MQVNIPYPDAPKYGVFIYMWVVLLVNVGNLTIHPASGIRWIGWVKPEQNMLGEQDSKLAILQVFQGDPNKKGWNPTQTKTRCWFQIYFFIFTPNLGEDFQFDEHIFQMG